MAHVTLRRFFELWLESSRTLPIQFMIKPWHVFWLKMSLHPCIGYHYDSQPCHRPHFISLLHFWRHYATWLCFRCHCQCRNTKTIDCAWIHFNFQWIAFFESPIFAGHWTLEKEVHWCKSNNLLVWSIGLKKSLFLAPDFLISFSLLSVSCITASAVIKMECVL